MGAVCEACEHDMEQALSCSVEARNPGVSLYGDDVPGEGWYEALKPDLPFRCRDCGVVRGGLHHVHCCIASCLVCGGQRMGCLCDCGDDVDGE